MASGCPAATSGDDPVGGGEGNQESREREREGVHEGVFCIWGSGQNQEKNVVESCSSNAASGQS